MKDMREKEIELILKDGTIITFRAIWNKDGAEGFVAQDGNELPSNLFKDEAFMWKSLFLSVVRNDKE